MLYATMALPRLIYWPLRSLPVESLHCCTLPYLLQTVLSSSSVN